MSDKVNKKIAFHTLGCKVNLCETEAMKRQFVEDGYEIVDFEEKADIYVINTCSVTSIADKKSRQMIHRARKMNPGAFVIAAGCYTEGLSELQAAELGCDRIISNAEKKEIVEQTRRLTGKAMAGRIRADVKIEDGCNQFCSYCIIPYRRGRVDRRKPEDILEEVRGLAQAGHREVVLTGIHISSYGADALLKLMEDIAQVPGIDRIRIGSLEPGIIDRGFLERLSQNPKVCRHFHLSLQSGCDRTLRAMNRHYTADEYRQKVALIRSFYEHPAITTDVIAGFPGESEEDFRESLSFTDEIGFYHMHIFPYSKREGTRAAKMPGQLTMKEKQERVDLLEETDIRNSEDFVRYYVGRKVSVLIEEECELDGVRYLSGLTDTYVRVLIPYAKGFKNRLVTVHIDSMAGKDLVKSDEKLIIT